MDDVRLELLDESHLPGIGRLAADPAVLRFARIDQPVPADFVERWWAGCQRGRADGTREAFAIVDRAGAFLGAALALSIRRQERTAELGYLVLPEARGRGAATAALRLLSEWAFASGLVRLELLISVENPASKRVAERCGYAFEGVLRSMHVREGFREDTEIWSRLPGDGIV
jgi:RimJ/RimL family protein N-acetyltransferase